MVWQAPPLSDSAWSARLYLRLTGCAPPVAWRRQFMAPNQLIELRPDGLSVIQAVPAAPGRCLVRRLDYTVLPPEDGARAVLYLVRRLAPYARRTMLEVAESVQRGMIDREPQVPDERRIRFRISLLPSPRFRRSADQK